MRTHRLTAVTPLSGHTRGLRVVMRIRDDLASVTSRLAALFGTRWPGAKAVFAALWSPIGLAFPASAGGPGEKHLAAVPDRLGCSGTRPAAVFRA